MIKRDKQEGLALFAVLLMYLAYFAMTGLGLWMLWEHELRHAVLCFVGTAILSHFIDVVTEKENE